MADKMGFLEFSNSLFVWSFRYVSAHGGLSSAKSLLFAMTGCYSVDIDLTAISFCQSLIYRIKNRLWVGRCCSGRI